MLNFGGMQPKLENERNRLEVFAHLQTLLLLCLSRENGCSPVIAAALEMWHNCICFIFSNLFQSLSSFTYHFLSHSVHPLLCLLNTSSPTLPLPLIPVGQQCSSSLVSIIIIQSVLLSTNCQHSTNACLAINAIFLFSSHNFSNLLSILNISFSCSCFYLSPPHSLFWANLLSSPLLLPSSFGCCYFQIGVTMVRTEGEGEKKKGEGRKCA